MSTTIAAVTDDHNQRTVRDDLPKLDGRIDQVDGRTVKGWIFDRSDHSRHVSVDIILDDTVVATVFANEHRADLGRASIGDGDHGFTAVIPKNMFDGSKKRLNVRASDTGYLVPSKGIKSIYMDPALGSTVSGGILGFYNGMLCGYAFDSDLPQQVLTIDLVVEGRAQRTVKAGKPLPEPFRRIAPSNVGFFLDVNEVEFEAILNGASKLQVTSDNYILPLASGFVETIASFALNSEGENLGASVTISEHVAIPIRINITVDERFVYAVRWHPKLSSRILPIFLKRSDWNGHFLSATIGAASLEIGGSPALLSAQPRDLISNGRFKEWEGSEPTKWTVSTANHVAVSKSFRAAPVPRARLLGHTSVRFQSSPLGKSVQGSSIAQNIGAIRLQEDSCLYFMIGGSAERPTEVRVEATFTYIGEHSTKPPVVAEASVSLDRSPSIQTAPLVAQTVSGELVDCSVTLTLGEGSSQYVDIGLIALGLPGFEVAPVKLEDMKDLTLEPERNAIANGDFAIWTSSFSKQMDSKSVETAEGWTLSSRTAKPEVNLRLVNILTRDVRSGDVGSSAYGLALTGPISENYLRLQTELDSLILATIDDIELSFYATADFLSVGRPEASPSTINEVFLLERRIENREGKPGKVTDRKICRLARNISVAQAGGVRRVVLDDTLKRMVKDVAQEAIYDQTRSILLVFEWQTGVHCALTNIRLGSTITPTRQIGRLQGDFVAFEDRNITDQLDRLKGLGDWSTQTIRTPYVSEPRVQSQLAAKWSWPSRQASIDIVIPVYNAIDDAMACLRSLERHTSIPHRVVVVDDCSEGHASEQLVRHQATRPWIQVIRNTTNKGYTRSSNIGMAASDSEWVVLLNSDTIVTPRWLEGLLEAAEERPEAAMIGPVSNAASWQSVPELYDSNGKWRINTIPTGYCIDDVALLVEELAPREFPYAPLLNGFCTLIKRQALDEVGYLDEATFPVGYGEENDLCVRISGAGYKLVVADHVYVYHRKSASFGLKQRDQLSKQGTRNFAKKHPHVDLKEVQQRLAEISSLAILRNKLREKLDA
ncbi:glycosyltransferase family 2 protein [Methylopila sp. M107]|uniref:glycosyltransferase family 2 protein n=1 Tax=Methylopila sp. M107 TaxID=1101190 RepID=UPI0003A3BA6A|nr:glycosyltransferase family 2 protein [Methylopila sp. M107]